MIMQHIVVNIFPVLFFFLEVCACIICDLSVCKRQFQIDILQFVQIDSADVKNALRPRKYRRCKYFTYRNIYVCHTVFKNRLFLRIPQFMKLYFQISLIRAFSLDPHINTLIQRVNDRLLHPFVQTGVQRIDPDHIVENLAVPLSDLRHRIRHNRKTPLLPFDIPVHKLPRFTVI